MNSFTITSSFSLEINCRIIHVNQTSKLHSYVITFVIVMLVNYINGSVKVRSVLINEDELSNHIQDPLKLLLQI